jgi:acyl-coenzyme A thioesterase PaaI-like protein
MPPQPSPNDLILPRVLSGIERNRMPGYHFPGNFLGLSFDALNPERSRVSLQGGPHCADRTGQAEITSVLILTDMALAAALRAELKRAVRVATVNMQLQFTGAARTGKLTGASRFAGYFHEGAAQQGLSSVRVTGDQGEVCFGTAAFMVLEPPKGVTFPPLLPLLKYKPAPPKITAADLSPEEKRIYAKAQAALKKSHSGGSFIEHLWNYRTRALKGGASALLTNGAHVGNRVGHVQGGILLGLTEACARVALPAGWKLSAISATYLTPGEGQQLKARAHIVHRGSRTAVVRCLVTGYEGRSVLETLATYAAPRG